MLARNQDARGQSTTLIIEVVNPPHMEDCLDHCRQHGIVDRFHHALMTVALRHIGAAANRERVVVKFIPNSAVQPMFVWTTHIDGVFLEKGKITYSENPRGFTCALD